MRVLILFGKHLLPDLSLDWVAIERANLAISLLNEDKSNEIIVTGGKTTSTTVSEAQPLKDLLIKNGISPNRVILEEEGKSTIDQLCRIKKEYLLKNKYNTIDLVSDELHIKRIYLLATYIFGPSYTIEIHGCEIKLSGHYKRAIEEKEKHLFQLLLENPILKKYAPGNHEIWSKFDQFYIDFKKNNAHDRLDIPDVNERFKDYIS